MWILCFVSCKYCIISEIKESLSEEILRDGNVPNIFHLNLVALESEGQMHYGWQKIIYTTSCLAGFITLLGLYGWANRGRVNRATDFGSR